MYHYKVTSKDFNGPIMSFTLLVVKGYELDFSDCEVL